MSHKIAKKARRLAREQGLEAGPTETMVDWKPVTKGKVRKIEVERPQARLVPGSFRSVVKKLKEKFS